MSPSASRRVCTSLLALMLLCALATSGHAFSLIGDSWPFGSTITIQLALGPTSVGLQDGSGTWNNSAAAALDLWNQHLQGVKFAAVPTSGTTGAQNDRTNSAFFSSTVYGEAFGSRTLAVTLTHTTTSEAADECDVIFNNQQRFNSYRGPLQVSGSAYLYDFQRVALHEFGHVLGLDHPDQHGQMVAAIMNSVISDLDHLTDDDIAAIASLYSIAIVGYLGPIRVTAGTAFRYEVNVTRSGTTFSASGLPPGLQINTTTGVISGNPTTAGTYDIPVTATIGVATASATLRIVVDPPAIGVAGYTTFEVGKPASFRITGTNSPTSFTASGLPDGMQLDTATGIVSGTPMTVGTYPLQVTATGAIGVAQAAFSIQIVPPSITSALEVGMGVGQTSSYRITASTPPTGFSASNLPPGLTLNAATGVISGIPTKPGVYSVRVIGFENIANATAMVHFNIVPPQIMNAFDVHNTSLGNQFGFRITVSVPPLAFSAVGLPPGLQLNTKTGVISGIATVSGTYQVTVTASTAYGDATATVIVYVAVPPPPVDKPVASWQVSGTRPLADPARPRVYVGTISGIAVIDTDTMAMQMIATAYPPCDLTISADGATLWFADTQGSHLGRVDLENLTALPYLPAAVGRLSQLRAGLGRQIYAVVGDSPRVLQVNTETGAVKPVWSSLGSQPQIELSPDRRTLYVADTNGAYPDRVAAFARFDVSTASPQRLQQTKEVLSHARTLLVPHSGASVDLVDWRSSGVDAYIRTIQPDDITQTIERVAQPVEGGDVAALSPDDRSMFLSEFYTATVGVVDTKSWRQVQTINIGGHSQLYSMAVDRSGAYLFTVSNDLLRAYRVKQPGPLAPAHSLLNVSTRLQTAPGDQQMIGGFIISGTAPKRVALRAIGPSLGTAATLADPALELYDSAGQLLAQNDNWNSTRQAVLDTGIPPVNEREAAIVAALAPGSYTAVVRGVNNTSGVALVELYDLDPTSSSLANISTRGAVGTGDNVMIGGFILGGDQPNSVVVRAIGPSLTQSGISGALLDPTLELHDANGGLIAQNDDWRSDQQQAIAATGIAPVDDRESALIETLPPGSYTAVVRGKNDTTGVALVEVYNLAR